MKDFLALLQQLDSTRARNARLESLGHYLAAAPPADFAWAVWLLCGHRFRRLVGPRLLRVWLCEHTGLPDWLVEESYRHVGDLAETISLLTADLSSHHDLPVQPLADWINQMVRPLQELDEDGRRTHVMTQWDQLPVDACVLFNKLLTGGLRVGVSRGLVAHAVAMHADLPLALITRRLMGSWQPGAAFYHYLLSPVAAREARGQPYPFFLASALDGAPDELGHPDQFLAEWKFDGIRGQLICRDGDVWLWSRGEELITERFPEITRAVKALGQDVVLDGELLAWDTSVLPFARLQTRIQRKRPNRRQLEETPVIFMAYDFLEQSGLDLRDLPLAQRRERLEALIPCSSSARLRLSPRLALGDWASLAVARSHSRALGVEGLMLKRMDAAYGYGRQRGAWWKWKVAPMTVDAVLLYAQPGHGRRASLYTDYTLAVWDSDALVPVTKAYSGLTNEELLELDGWIRRHTVERFGPVRSVTPAQVFEIAFEGIQSSSRAKSGMALRFPRIQRWRRDLSPKDADDIFMLRDLLRDAGG